MEQRSDWADHAKGIGIVLVVYGHVVRGLVSGGVVGASPVWQVIDQIIYSFHMPLFFFLAGLFFWPSRQRRTAGAFLAGKVDTIVYPYLLWSLLQGCLEVLLSRYTNGHTTISEVLALLWLPRAQFWFLYALFLIVVFSLVVYWRRSLLVSLLGLALGAALYLYSDRFPATYRPWLLTVNFVFFAAGVSFSHAKNCARRHAQWLWWSLVSLALGAQWVYASVLQMNYRMGGWPTLLTALVSISAVVALSMAACRRGWVGADQLAALGRASMAIYLMHVLVCSGVRVVLRKILGVDDELVHVAVGTSLGLLVPWAFKIRAQALGLGWLFSPPKRFALAVRAHR